MTSGRGVQVGIDVATRLEEVGAVPVLTDRQMRWPDTFSEGPDGRIYGTASHIQDTAWFKPGASPSIATELFAFNPAALGREN